MKLKETQQLSATTNWLAPKLVKESRSLYLIRLAHAPMALAIVIMYLYFTTRKLKEPPVRLLAWWFKLLWLTLEMFFLAEATLTKFLLVVTSTMRLAEPWTPIYCLISKASLSSFRLSEVMLIYSLAQRLPRILPSKIMSIAQELV